MKKMESIKLAIKYFLLGDTWSDAKHMADQVVFGWKKY